MRIKMGLALAVGAAMLLSACGNALTPRQLAGGLATEYAVVQDAALDFMDTPAATPAVKVAIKTADRAAIAGIEAVIDAAKDTPAGDNPAAETEEGEAAQSRFTSVYDYATSLIASLGSLVGV